LKSHLRGLEFHYSDPIPNFDRKKVKGLVANVIQIEPEKLDWTNALEICAGNRLFNVRRIHINTCNGTR
jgi:structural maintenance of chromosome 2